LHAHAQRALALVGPGRAGTTMATALLTREWTAIAVAGRAADSPGVLAAATRFGAAPRSLADAGRGAELVLVATPDAAIADVAQALAPGLEPGALVLHLSGACTLHELDKLAITRPDVRLGSLHPLQSLPSAELGVARLPGSWCAVDGPDDVERLAVSLGMRPFRVDAARRASYHAAATVASNHLVALLGQAARLAADAGMPPEALLPLVRATVDNVDALGPADALTGPVARGDVDTVLRHLEAVEPSERPAYRALASEALKLTARRDTELERILDAPERGQ
jgi:predicted short-subunit dehydrogenase-like oxidoreductase (DUF2520 family)